MLGSIHVKAPGSYVVFISSRQIYDARHISHLAGELKLGIVYVLDRLPPCFILHASRSFSTSFVTMTIATVLLQATSFVSSLSQLRTNGKHPWLPFQFICVLLASNEALCLQHYRQGGSNLGTFAAPKLPQFLENK